MGPNVQSGKNGMGSNVHGTNCLAPRSRSLLLKKKIMMQLANATQISGSKVKVTCLQYTFDLLHNNFSAPCDLLILNSGCQLVLLIPTFSYFSYFFSFVPTFFFLFFSQNLLLFLLFGFQNYVKFYVSFDIRMDRSATDVGDFVPFRFRAITISCHFGDFVPPIGFIRVYFHTY